MKRLVTRKRVVVLTVAALAIGISGGAYAWFSSTGSGTGSASVGTSTAVTLHGSTSGTLYPATNETVTLTVDNTGGGNEYVGTIYLASITADGGHASCSTTIADGSGAKDTSKDFYMPDKIVNTDYTPGSGQAAGTSTLYMNDTGVSQNGCQGATLTLHLTSN